MTVPLQYADLSGFCGLPCIILLNDKLFFHIQLLVHSVHPSGPVWLFWGIFSVVPEPEVCFLPSVQLTGPKMRITLEENVVTPAFHLHGMTFFHKTSISITSLSICLGNTVSVEKWIRWLLLNHHFAKDKTASITASIFTLLFSDPHYRSWQSWANTI